jgi:hypothetical protein
VWGSRCSAAGNTASRKPLYQSPCFQNAQRGKHLGSCQSGVIDHAIDQTAISAVWNSGEYLLFGLSKDLLGGPPRLGNCR